MTEEQRDNLLLEMKEDNKKRDALLLNIQNIVMNMQQDDIKRDEKIDRMDKRLDGMDKRLDDMDKRLVNVEANIDDMIPFIEYVQIEFEKVHKELKSNNNVSYANFKKA